MAFIFAKARIKIMKLKMGVTGKHFRTIAKPVSAVIIALLTLAVLIFGGQCARKSKIPLA